MLKALGWECVGQEPDEKGRRVATDRSCDYALFAEALKKADAEAESADVLIIKQAAKKSWQAAAWLLERKRFQRWARREKMEHSGPDGGAIRTESKLTVKDIQKIVEGLAGTRIDPDTPAMTWHA